MWTTLVSLIERWWKEKPRLDLIRAVVGLRDAMIDCQSSYEECMENIQDIQAIKAIKFDNPYKIDNPQHVSALSKRQRWKISLMDLTRAIDRLDDVLSIFSPETKRALTDYAISENIEFEAFRRLLVVGRELNQPIDLKPVPSELSTNFRTALERLNEFIISNFKAEEIHAVATSKWR